MSSRCYNIAGHLVSICPEADGDGVLQLLPSFRPFEVAPQAGVPPLLTLTVTGNDEEVAQPKTLVRQFDTGNGHTTVYQLADGGYEFLIADVHDTLCCHLVAGRRFSQCRCSLHGNQGNRSFGLNNALMLAYAFAASYHHTLLIHASAVVLPHPAGGPLPLGFAFVAPSGTGKSTHTALWMKHVAQAQLLNDDNPVVRITHGQPLLYGSPWSGKTPCYRKRRARLAAVTSIEQAPANHIVQLPPVQAFAALLPACSSMKWDAEVHNNLCNTLSALMASTPVYTLQCLPDAEAALLSSATLTAPWRK